MAAIKRFFEKKKLDIKFKTAGGGHKLNESSSRPSSSRPNVEAGPSAGSRRAKTDDSRMAGQAALTRMTSQERGRTADIGKGIHAIKLQVKKEMEAERKAQATSESYAPPKEVDLDGAPVLSVTGVFFKCPMVGDFALPRKEMENHIHEFLLTQLSEEPEMTSALMIQTLNKDKDKVKACIDILCKYLDNIISNPEEEKYRRIRLNNKVFQERVIPMEGSQEFMQAGGFEIRSMPGPNEVEEDFYVMIAERAKDTDRVKSTKDVLLAAEPIRPELDNNLRIYYPSAKGSHFEVPPDFYNISPEELKKEQQARTEAVERLGMLRTKEMREREYLRELRRYRYTLIRVRFPDGVIVQGTFRAMDKHAVLMHFIRDILENSWMPFYLLTSTGQKLTDETKTLAELELAPAAILNFSWDPTVQAEIAAQKGTSDQMNYIQEEVMAMIQYL